MICPDCAGRKTVTGLAKYSDGRPCGVETYPCFRCKGSGEVSDQVAQWIEQGRRLYRERLDGEPYRSILQAACWLGVPVLDLADAEHGRRDPSSYLAMYAERRLRALTLADLEDDD